MRRLNQHQQSIIKITLHLQWWRIFYCSRFINVREKNSDPGYLSRKWVSESLAWPFHHFFNNRQGLRVRVPDQKYLSTALLTNKIHEVKFLDTLIFLKVQVSDRKLSYKFGFSLHLNPIPPIEPHCSCFTVSINQSPLWCEY